MEPKYVSKQEKLFLSKDVIIAEIIKWGIRQNPFAGRLPRKTGTVLEKLHTLLPDGLLEIEDIRAYIRSLIDQVPEILEWNLSEIEFQNGTRANSPGDLLDDPARNGIVVVSRYGGTSPEHDCIDIDALKGNVIFSLRKEFEEG